MNIKFHSGPDLGPTSCTFKKEVGCILKKKRKEVTWKAY